MTKSFVHLHAHTEYSMLDGAAKIVDYLKKVKELNQPAAAITDHGNLYGAMEFVQKANDYGIKPIIGYEAYITPGSRFDRPDRENNKRYHLTLLAENNIGYQNLVELVSKAYTEGYYYKPRIDKNILEKNNEGIIVLSGCPSSELSRSIISTNEEKIKQTYGWFSDVFRDRFYLEIMDHIGVPHQKEINKKLMKN